MELCLVRQSLQPTQLRCMWIALLAKGAHADAVSAYGLFQIILARLESAARHEGKHRKDHVKHIINIWRQAKLAMGHVSKQW
eukprot:1512192-Amphidinium_carterae.1